MPSPTDLDDLVKLLREDAAKVAGKRTIPDRNSNDFDRGYFAARAAAAVAIHATDLSPEAEALVAKIKGEGAALADEAERMERMLTEALAERDRDIANLKDQVASVYATNREVSAANEALEARLAHFENRERDLIQERANCEHVPVPSGYGHVCSACGLEL